MSSSVSGGTEPGTGGGSSSEVENSSLLSETVLGALIVSGIKFFLYQRNQIPIPYDKLRAIPVGTPNAMATSCAKHEYQIDDEGMPIMQRSCVPLEEKSRVRRIAIDDCADMKARIRLLKSWRKERALERKRSFQLKKQMRDELKIKNCWDKAFDILLSILGSDRDSKKHHYGQILGVVLMFGQTVFNPREIIVFELSHKGEDDYFNDAMEVDLPGLLRKFFRSIIMCDEFLIITENPLQRTGSHICLLSDTAIPENISQFNDLTLLERFPLCKMEAICKAKSKFISPISKRIFHVKLNLTDYSFEVCRDDFTLFRKKSYLFYQVPLQFRGIQWRNK